MLGRMNDHEKAYLLAAGIYLSPNKFGILNTLADDRPVLKPNRERSYALCPRCSYSEDMIKDIAAL